MSSDSPLSGRETRRERPSIALSNRLIALTRLSKGRLAGRRPSAAPAEREPDVLSTGPHVLDLVQWATNHRPATKSASLLCFSRTNRAFDPHPVPSPADQDSELRGRDRSRC